MISKSIGLASTVISLIFVSQLAKAHGDVYEMEPSWDPQVSAGDIAVDFDLIDTENKIILKDKHLAALHQKKLHVFIFDKALNEFFHVHPEFIDDQWRVPVKILKNGEYKVFAQGKVLSTGEEFSANTDLKIISGSPANPVPPKLTDVREGSSELSRLNVSNEVLKAKKMVMLTLTFSRTDGGAPKITPYLGEMAHVIAVTAKADKMVHVHPMATGKPNTLMLHVEFPDVGFYRMWAQFIDDGALKTIPLSVEVLK